MAQVGKVIYDLLTNNATISAACSTRIFPLFAPQEAADPCITYFLDQIQFNETKDGASELNNETYRINVFSKTYTEAKDLSDAVITELDRFSGTNNGVKVSNTVLKDVNELYDNIDRLFQINLEFDFIINV
jgi:hypothetical protein